VGIFSKETNTIIAEYENSGNRIVWCYNGETERQYHENEEWKFVKRDDWYKYDARNLNWRWGHHPSGKVMVYDEVSGDLKVILSGLYRCRGTALDGSGRYLFINLGGNTYGASGRIVRVDLMDDLPCRNPLLIYKDSPKTRKFISMCIALCEMLYMVL